jgi:hypothetical protein
MLKVAVIWLALTKVTLVAVTPDPLIATVAPETKPVPARETLTELPCVPMFGVTEVKVGPPLDGVVTVNGRVLLVPAAVATLTL